MLSGIDAMGAVDFALVGLAEQISPRLALEIRLALAGIIEEIAPLYTAFDSFCQIPRFLGVKAFDSRSSKGGAS